MALPPLTPVITPVPVVAVAIDVLLLLHAPPVDVELSVVVAPAHTVAVPVIADGSVFTVTTTVALHPDAGV